MYSLTEISFLISKDQITAKVIKIDYYDTYNKLTVRSGFKKYIVNDNNFLNIKIGDLVKFKNNFLDSDTNHLENSFNYQLYLKRNKIYGVTKEFILLNENRFSISIIAFYMQTYLEKFFSNNSLLLLKGVLLGDTSGYSQDLSDLISVNGINHLFAVSGLHISIFITIITEVLSTLKVKKFNIFIITFLIFYIIASSFSVSIIRVSLMYCLSLINKNKNMKLSSLDIASISAIILLIINPYYMYSIGFILSYLVTISIILISPLISNTSKLNSLFIISLLAQVVTFPIVININNSFNLLSVFVNMIMVTISSSIILPLAILTAFFPVLEFFFEVIATIFFFINEACFRFAININVATFKNYQMILYYLLLIFIIYFLKTKSKSSFKAILFLGIFLICSFTIYRFVPTIYFLDLYNGESTLIMNYKYNVLIDTGDGSNYQVTKFLKSQGINIIDYLILTHNHNDHNGEVPNIEKNFFIRNIIISEYDSSGFEKYSNSQIIVYDNIIKLQNMTIKFIHPDQRYSDENDNSLAFILTINNTNILFTGDISKKVEEKVASKMTTKINILKVAHHGSITSSSEEFIQKINPQYAVIMAGRIAKFDFPHSQVINILENQNVKIYRTDKHYSIKLKIFKNQCIFYPLK